MNKILEKNYVENVLKTLDDLNYLTFDAIDYVSNRIIIELLKQINSNSFNRFGEVLEYTIDESLVSEKFLNGNLDDISSLKLNLMVVKAGHKILVIEAQIADGFYDYIRIGNTLGYLDGNKVWLKNYSTSEYNEFSKKLDKITSSSNLILLNAVNKNARKEIYEYVSQKLSEIRNKQSFKAKIEENKENTTNLSLTGYSFLENMDKNSECDLKIDWFDNAILDKIQTIGTKLIKLVVNELCNLEELQYGENSINPHLFIDNKERFWDIIDSNLENIMLDKTISYYTKIDYLKMQYEITRNLVPNYNLIKAYNVKINSIQKEINDALDNKCRTVNIEFKGDIFNIKSQAICFKRKYRNNNDFVILTDLCFSEYGDGVKLLSPNQIDTFKIMIRKTVIYEFKEEDVKELEDLIKKIKDSEISEQFNIFNK